MEYSRSKVIGGEFKIELISSIKYKESILPKAKEYASGRTALHAILEVLKSDGYNNIYIPDYLCQSILLPIHNLEMEYTFYHINDELLPEIAPQLFKAKSSILFINYFGLIDLSNSIANVRRDSDAKIIIDDVQNYFDDTNIDFDFRFTSLRKWFPVPDGAYVYGKDNLLMRMKAYEKEGEFSKYKYAGNLLKNFDYIIGDKIALELIEKGEYLIDKEYLVKPSECSREIFNTIDYNVVSKIRRNNARLLHNGLDKLGVKHLYADEAVPLFIPIFIKNRDDLRKEFFKKNIFCPIHWPKINSIMNSYNTVYDTELSLICDQRYGENEMKAQLEILENEYKNL